MGQLKPGSCVHVSSCVEMWGRETVFFLCSMAGAAEGSYDGSLRSFQPLRGALLPALRVAFAFVTRGLEWAGLWNPKHLSFRCVGGGAGVPMENSTFWLSLRAVCSHEQKIYSLFLEQVGLVVFPESDRPV